VLWGTDNLKNEGAPIAQALALRGAKACCRARPPPTSRSIVCCARIPGRDYAGMVVAGDGWKGKEVWESGAGFNDRSRKLPRTVANWVCSMAAHYAYRPTRLKLRIVFRDKKSNGIPRE
jgi:hypothetical protein